jgi:hypothetical protein
MFLGREKEWVSICKLLVAFLFCNIIQNVHVFSQNSEWVLIRFTLFLLFLLYFIFLFAVKEMKEERTRFEIDQYLLIKQK